MATLVLPEYIEGVDEATARLIIELEINDIEQFQSSARAKYTVGSDTDVAFRLRRNELEQTLQIIQDRGIALRMNHGRPNAARSLRRQRTRQVQAAPQPEPIQILATQQASPDRREPDDIQISTVDQSQVPGLDQGATLSAHQAPVSAKPPIIISDTVVASSASSSVSTAQNSVVLKPQNLFTAFCGQRASSISLWSTQDATNPSSTVLKSSIATPGTQSCCLPAANIDDSLALVSSADWQDEVSKSGNRTHLNTQTYDPDNPDEEESAEGYEWVYEDDNEIEEVVAESSASGASRKPTTRRKKVPRRLCVACREHVVAYYVTQLPCGEEYCAECLQELFSTSLVDESLFPPRCCRQPIDPEEIEEFLTPELIAAYEEKKAEVETVDRTYCSDPRCSIFLRPENIFGDCATCPKCNKETCTLCKAPNHEEDCPADEATQEVLKMAKENGWQRCKTCRRMISISTGCNHMRCICQAAWCYLCGKTWKTCPCPQWNERLLIHRANEVVDRQPGQPHVARAAAVAAAVADLRERRERCDHRSWLFSLGGRQCESCNEVMTEFIMQCRRCRVSFCKRCTLNRP